MRIPDSRLHDLLLKNKKVSTEQLDALVAEGKKENKPLQEIALKQQIVTESELARLYADSIDIPFVDLSEQKIDKSILERIPERIATKYRVALFDVTEDGIPKLAMSDPDDLQAIDFLEKQLGKNLKIFVATETQILKVLDQYKGTLDSEITKVITSEEQDEEEQISEEDIAEDSPIAQTVNIIIEYAIKQGASDIHIEPREDFVQIRYRIDGILKEANQLPKNVIAALVSRIKILAGLKIDERRAPQDGRFKIEKLGRIIALRVSTLPVMDGEKVVMRLLDETAEALALEDLGFESVSLKNMRKAMSEPHGIILVTGPTGSGKSTTLFSVLSALNKPEVNISTIEDPVEYRIEGANQTQVNPKAGMTFASGLRALLRQDPNIIMVGEVRDGETAGLAIQAALTGHLVFSTLHTNNAATSLPRLLDMGAEPFLISTTVRAVVGQRLVRKLCTECKIPYQPSKKAVEQMKESFRIEDAIARLNKQVNEASEEGEDEDQSKNETQAKRNKTPEPASKHQKVIEPAETPEDEDNIIEKIKNDPNIVNRSETEAAAKEIVQNVKAEAKAKEEAEQESDKKDEAADEELANIVANQTIDNFTLFRPNPEGCEKCGKGGYKGRLGIYEVLYNTEKIARLISSDATAEDLQAQAIREGMLTMTEDGLVKALKGLTSIEEIMRVTHE